MKTSTRLVNLPGMKLYFNNSEPVETKIENGEPLKETYCE
jgi:hypothetical protein